MTAPSPLEQAVERLTEDNRASEVDGPRSATTVLKSDLRLVLSALSLYKAECEAVGVHEIAYRAGKPWGDDAEAALQALLSTCVRAATDAEVEK